MADIKEHVALIKGEQVASNESFIVYGPQSGLRGEHRNFDAAAMLADGSNASYD